MKKKELQNEMDQVLDIKNPLELLLFVGEYYDSMSSESRWKLLEEVWGITLLRINDEELPPEQYKFQLGWIFSKHFKKPKPGPRPILLGLFMNQLGNHEWLLDPLKRPGSIIQVHYLKWLIDLSDMRLSDDEKDAYIAAAPEYIKKYLHIE